MRNLSKSVRIGIGVALLLGLGLLGGWLTLKPTPKPLENPIIVILTQSGALRQMALHTRVLGINQQDLSWEGQKPTNLSQIYQDLWPIKPPTFPKIPTLTWQMGWADGRIVFFLDGLPVDVCQSLNQALNVKADIPESPWSKQDLLRRKASLPPVQNHALAHRGCVKTIFATHLYYEIL
jgi:hypothetical protein